MSIDRKNIISVTRLQRDLTSQIRSIAEGDSPLFILKNNEVQAVIVSADEYEHLQNLNELVEQMQIHETIESRLTGYNPSENISWQNLQNG